MGVLGTGKTAHILGAMEILYKNNTETIYSYETKENYEEIVNYVAVKDDLLKQCESLALDVWRTLNCYDGGRVDVKIDKQGNLSFIEVNPLAGLNPITSDLPILCKLNGICYQEIIDEILKSAIKRNFKL